MMEGEEVIWSGRKGIRYRLFLLLRDTVFFGAILYVVHMIVSTGLFSFLVNNWSVYLILVLIGVLIISVRQLVFLFSSYHITTERVLLVDGFFSRRLTSIKHENVRDMKLVQSFSHRLIGVGDVFIFTSNDSGEGGKQADFLQQVPCLRTIDNPLRIHAMLEQMCEKI